MAVEKPEIEAKGMSWREYQEALKRKREARKRSWFVFKWASMFVLALVLAIGIAFGVTEFYPRFVTEKKEQAPAIEMLSKAQIRNLMHGQRLWDVAEEPPQVALEGKTYELTSTLDLEFQRHMLAELKPEYARAIAFVAMEPQTGKVLTMVGYHKDPKAGNPCTQVLFPAASVYKMVTAAAAMDDKNFTPQTPVRYNGKKHTLYKSQLKDVDNKYTRHIDLEEAFSDSINPVFGKIGVLLGPEALTAKSKAMGFEQDLGVECDFNPSQLGKPEDKYRTAEIASGFNRETLISAMHGAAMASAVLNNGVMPQPYIIASAENQENQVVYEGGLTPMGQAMSETSSLGLQKMMVDAACHGTGRGCFSRRQRGKALREIVVGGKTGSINNDTDYDIRYDWFVGFAHDKENQKQLAFAAIVAHEDYIGKKAGDYCKDAIEYYFD
ncbi:penicillin-binding transpeptidase domain-containing protein [Desulfatibacillum aliphaticivorans]|uniref:penicillin-binding transpeptidase domain-containing protein n=1 Tax=Desulfatibacillum aliphaticivorans TaxID=218208 RepID=UPI0004188ECA|nr:penicillin-binding transpeptidase domain-containing protein [Desulfatibacillum aliphaticivorans]